MSQTLQAHPQAVYSSIVDALEPTDSAVPAIWNDVFQVLLNNDAALQRRLVQIETQGAVPDGSVSDAKLGPRTANPNLFPAAGTSSGTLTQWLGWLTNRLRQITGRPNWWENPRISLEHALDKRGGDTLSGDTFLAPRARLIGDANDDWSMIAASTNSGLIRFAGGPTANPNEGAWIQLDGRHRGGTDQGGNIHLVPVANGVVRIGSQVAYHSGNHIHRTDAQNDARYVLRGENVGRTDAQNDLRYLRRDTSGTLEGNLSVAGTVTASALSAERMLFSNTQHRWASWSFGPLTWEIPGRNVVVDGSVRYDWHNGSRGYAVYTFHVPNMPQQPCIVTNLANLLPPNIEPRLTLHGNTLHVSLFNHHPSTAHYSGFTLRVIAVGV